jgi:very-short-patch-repair endonuclease
VKPQLRDFARRLRTGSTEEEGRLWALLRNRRFAEYKFRRQVPIDRYIADFVCHSARLVVELDGSQHVESERDMIRDAAIQRHGYRILRIWNNDLTHARDSVLDAVWHALNPQGAQP